MISPQASVSPNAKLGKNVIIHPFVVIQDDVEIGDNTEIMSFTTIVSGTRIGSDNKIYEGCVIGADPQDFRWKGEKTRCEIGNNNTIREHVIINRSIRPDRATKIGDNVFIMAQSHIGHDSLVKGRCVIGNGCSLAGDTEVGECTILSSRVILHEGAKVGDWALVKGGCRINAAVPPFAIMAHNPAEFFGVNAYIMRKQGMTEDDIDTAAKCFRHLYQTQTSVFNALKRIAADVEPNPVRDKITDFITSVNNRLVGIPDELNG